MILEFLKYLIKSVFEGVDDDMKEIFMVITKKKTWVFGCFAFLIVAIFMQKLNLIILGAILFAFFFVTYQYQVFEEDYTHQRREGYKK